MPKLCNVEKCCGCASCAETCARRAIEMKPDRYGFLHPVVSPDRCVECGACERACPTLRVPDSCRPLGVYASRALDETIRLSSSSGGIFTLLARQTLQAGGVVFGAALSEDGRRVLHRGVQTEDGLGLLRGSKYVQSDLAAALPEVRSALASGRVVLFSGTPCQVAGLRQFLGKVSANLLCVETVCHAVPSPLAWQYYLDSADLGRCLQVEFRNKSRGWENYSLRIVGERGTLESPVETDSFLRGFRKHLFNRRSCADCSFRGFRSGADITLGDFWHVRESLPDMDDGKGTSLVVINTERGAAAYADLRGLVLDRASDLKTAYRANPSLVRSSRPHYNRSVFFCLLRHIGKGFDGLVREMLEPSFFQRIINKVLRCVLES